MKCLHILPMNKLSGAEKMALIMCKNMKNYEPIVVCGGENLKKVFEDKGIKTYALTFSNKKLFSTMRKLKNIIKENEVNLIHAHDNNASLKAYMVKRIYSLNIKIISHIHNCYPWLKNDSKNKKIDAFIRPRYDHNITCGKVVYDFYQQHTNYLYKNKTTVLSNAMDIDEITKVDTTKSEEVIKEFNIPKDKTIIGFIGRLHEQKGIIPFIKEFANYKESFKDCKMLLVGNGEQEKQVKALLKELELEEYFILTGFQDNVYKFYPIIDIFFLPSLYEGLPMVILEAMAFKKPIVSMNVGSISEVINKETGIIVEQGEYKVFINKLIEAKGNKHKLKAYGEKAFSFINENYNIHSYVKKIEEKYSELKKVI